MRIDLDGRPTTNLVQRLLPKPGSEFGARASRAFGGGLLGLGDEAWRLLQEFCDIDYMGAAEYEFGTFPRAIQAMLGHDHCLWSFTIPASDVVRGYWRVDAVDALRRAEIAAARERGEKPPRLTKKHKARLEERAAQHAVHDHEIWVWCRADENRGQVRDLVRRAAAGELRVKAGLHFDLDPNPSLSGRRPVGWVDLINHLCWFTDKAMAESWHAMLSNNDKERT